MSTSTFCVEDYCTLKGDSSKRGLIERIWHDVDSHVPYPQQEYGMSIKCHKDIPNRAFKTFLKDGVPPMGTALVAWNTADSMELIKETELKLLDRSLMVGDTVRREARGLLSGTVMGTRVTCSLAPDHLMHHLDERGTEIFDRNVPNDRVLHEVPAEELQHTHEYRLGDFVQYKDWVGVVESIDDEVTVRLKSGAVVIEEPDELAVAGNSEHNDPRFPTQSLQVGDFVCAKKGVFRRGRWKFGQYNPNDLPCGKVVDVRAVGISVSWLSRRPAPPTPTMPGGFPYEPPEELDLDTLQSGEVHIYDRTTSSNSSSQGVPSHTARVTSNTGWSFLLGDKVRFRNLPAAMEEYNSTTLLSDGKRQGRIERIPRTETLGYDMNVFTVAGVTTEVTVQWQDRTITSERSTAVVPDLTQDDDNDAWPGEIVGSLAQTILDDGKSSDGEPLCKPDQIGVVQSVNPAERMVEVRWFPNADVTFLGASLVPGSSLGDPSPDVESLSLYDVRVSTALSRRLGEFVTISQQSTEQDIGMHKLDWFGEVVELGLDGKTTVRLGGLNPVQDVRVSAEHCHHAYSADEDGLDGEPGGGDMTEGSDYDSEEEMDWAEDDSEAAFEYIYMDGERRDDDGDDEAWTTESEDEADSEGDAKMTDVPTPTTTPESLPPSSKNVRVHDSPVTDIAQPSTPPAKFSPSEPLNFLSRPGAPESFAILDGPLPADHHCYSMINTGLSGQSLLNRIRKEHKILRSSLPSGVYVRTWDTRLDAFRALILGPSDTPYELAPFVIDISLGANYPATPPNVFFHSWTDDGNGAINPNLYTDGKICLSLLGTWSGEKGENWNPARSTILQVLVSVLGLVLVREPYFNEAGYEVRVGAESSVRESRLYNERTYFRSRRFITHALRQPPGGMEDVVKWLYVDAAEGAPKLLQHAWELAMGTVERSEREDEGERDGIRKVTKGAVVPLKRAVEDMRKVGKDMTSS